MLDSDPDFYATFARILNSDQSRSVILCGNVHDLFHDGVRHRPLIPFLCERSKTEGILRIVYELNGPVRILDEHESLKNAWISSVAGVDVGTLKLRDLRAKGPTEYEQRRAEFDQTLRNTRQNPNHALELLRLLTYCSRKSRLKEKLLIFIEAADMLLPAGGGDVASLNDRQLRRIGVVQDWFCDPDFVAGGDSVCLVAESRGLIHPRVARLPQVLSVEIPTPDLEARRQYIDQTVALSPQKTKLWGSTEELARFTAGLSIHAIRQLLAGAAYSDLPLKPNDVVDKVEEFIQGQIGDEVVEFKKPQHTLDDVVGFTRLKRFLRAELIPRFLAPPDKALSGAAVAGPIGSGKTFIFEAVAAELDMPVLVLKNIRSQWFGQTDVIFERLRRALEALDKVVIFVDEADTQFGGVGSQTHDTERRLTGKIQAMMSDPQLRGRVIWLLMTARIHLLSPDIRRPGRVGDLIIPVLDPQGDDRLAFLEWTLRDIVQATDQATLWSIDELTQGYSAAAFASLRQHLKAVEPANIDQVVEIIQDRIPPDIEETRRYQTLQAMLNCTRRSLLPDADGAESDREAWRAEIQQLEAKGIH